MQGPHFTVPIEHFQPSFTLVEIKVKVYYWCLSVAHSTTACCGSKFAILHIKEVFFFCGVWLLLTYSDAFENQHRAKKNCYIRLPNKVGVGLVGQEYQNFAFPGKV